MKSKILKTNNYYREIKVLIIIILVKLKRKPKNQN